MSIDGGAYGTAKGEDFHIRCATAEKLPNFVRMRHALLKKGAVSEYCAKNGLEEKYVQQSPRNESRIHT